MSVFEWKQGSEECGMLGSWFCQPTFLLFWFCPKPGELWEKLLTWPEFQAPADKEILLQPAVFFILHRFQRLESSSYFYSDGKRIYFTPVIAQGKHGLLPVLKKMLFSARSRATFLVIRCSDDIFLECDQSKKKEKYNSFEKGLPFYPGSLF